jgi:RimJ/RimL family protein N-acetyltransferase
MKSVRCRIHCRRLTQAAWGRGYATEAANAALTDGFNRCGFEHVIATVQPANIASAGVATKLGMRQIDAGVPGRDVADEADAQNDDIVTFAITREEWLAGATARL